MSDADYMYMAEAERLLEPLTPEEQRVVTTDRGMQLIVLGANVRAQAFATLELVRQQARLADAAEVANLIAWKQLHTPRAVDARGLFNDLPVIRDDLSVSIETAMGLGL